jgi:phosphatidylglycerol:prolipoprotein diacylglycerol transferase
MLVHPQFDPIALDLSRLGIPLSIHWYGLTYLVAFGLFLWLATLRARQPAFAQAGWTRRDAEDLLFYGVLGVVIGGRLGYVLFYKPGYYAGHPLEAFAVWKGGMAFHGGLLGVVAAIALFARFNHLPWLSLGDLVAATVPIGLFFGRIANFINGELYGKLTTVPWAVDFPARVLDAGDAPGPRHPSQLYEACLEGLVLFLVLRYFTHSRGSLKQPGLTAGIFLCGYGMARIISEIFREWDYSLYFTTNYFSQGMVYSLPMVAAGAFLILRATRRHTVAA